MLHTIILKDNDTLVVVVKTGHPTVEDPMGEKAGMMKSFRLVATPTGPIFELLAYRPLPTFLTESEVKRVEDTIWT